MKSPSDADVEARIQQLEREVERLKAARLFDPAAAVAERISGPVRCPAFPELGATVDRDEETDGYSVRVSGGGWLLCGPERFSAAEAVAEWNRRWARVHP